MNTIALTAEEICEKAGESRRKINKLFREMDDSYKWPIRNQFNVTERAIRKARILERANGSMSPLEYAYFLEEETSRIVNDPKWQ